MRSFDFLLTLCGIVSFFQDAKSVTFVGCFLSDPAVSTPRDVTAIGWIDNYSLEMDDSKIPLCVAHCSRQGQKYAGIVTAAGGHMSCVCGEERPYGKLRSPVHTQPHVPCHHRIWSMEVYVAQGDFSQQHVGCYKEVADPANMASSSHNWIDKWLMSPQQCINYCKNNEATFASLRNGDTCTCDQSYAKYGKSTECNVLCAGSRGEKCGGKLANSVYLTMSTEEAAKQATSLTRWGGLEPVALPTTQTLVQQLLSIQLAVERRNPEQDAETLHQHFMNEKQHLQQVVDMKQPLAKMVASSGFMASNSPQIRRLLSGNVIPPLQPFVSVFKHAWSFIDRDVRQLVDAVDDAVRFSVPLNAAVALASSRLGSYFQDNSMLPTILSKTLKTAQMMVSASRTCLPLLGSKKSVMAAHLEAVSKTLIEGPHGSRQYLQVLRQLPFPAPPTPSAAFPNIDTKVWQGYLTDIATSWTVFVSTYGTKLFTLLQKTYSVPCVSSTSSTGSVIGKRALCQHGLFEMARRPGTNQAKEDIIHFVADNAVAFHAFSWKTFDDKIVAMLRFIVFLRHDLRRTGMEPSAVIQRQEMLTSYKYHQTCIDNISTMIQDVCHESSSPNYSKVSAFQKGISC